MIVLLGAAGAGESTVPVPPPPVSSVNEAARPPRVAEPAPPASLFSPPPAHPAPPPVSAPTSGGDESWGRAVPAVLSFPHPKPPAAKPRAAAGPAAVIMPPAASTAPTGPRRWLTRPIRFAVQGLPFRDFLRDFCAFQGVACEVSERVDGTVSGRFASDDPGEILDAVADAQRVNWYFDGVVAYFFGDAEVEMRFLPLRNVSEADLRRTLVLFGLFDERFPWRSADDGGMLMVQGPAVYLDRVEAMLERRQSAVAEDRSRKELGVFRLKHAWAAEQTVVVGTGQAKVPGVADLLRRIVDAGPVGGAASGAGGDFALPGEPRRMKGTGVIARRAAEAEPPPPAPAETDDGRGRPFIEADTRLNAVLVWDYPENLRRCEALIRALDQPLALIEIRAAIVDVETDRMRDLGIAWEYRRDGDRWTQNVGANPGTLGSYDNISGNGFQYATIFAKGLDHLMLRIRALEEDGDANVLSRPSVLTQDNAQATLEHTETFYVRLQGQDEVDLADIKTGLTLRVTPHVVPGDGDCGDDADGARQVQLAVYITSGSDTGNAETVDGLPTVRQSTISTQAVIHEGEALVIGGTYAETRRVNNSGVPVLKNIPKVGALFRRKDSTLVKNERLFMISPRVVRPGTSPIAPGTEAERVFDAPGPAREAMDAPAFDGRFPPDVPQGKTLRSRFVREDR